MNMDTVKTLLEIFEVDSIKYLIQKLSEGAYSFEIGPYETLSNATTWQEFWSIVESLDEIECSCEHGYDTNCQYMRFEALKMKTLI